MKASLTILGLTGILLSALAAGDSISDRAEVDSSCEAVGTESMAAPELTKGNELAPLGASSGSGEIRPFTEGHPNGWCYKIQTVCSINPACISVIHANVTNVKGNPNYSLTGFGNGIRCGVEECGEIGCPCGLPKAYRYCDIDGLKFPLSLSEVID